ncbi:interferon a3-like [Micropterus salmoides]|uniref:interferon a3-like n=1 Tax=Micropterus salmoides TaxID=27706 RepID=UPI0018ED705A|nr:interferon a3-like [Micropterus salmoides]XP_038592077.1 interferon a3-like [Micropterus salmoides]
MLNRIFSVCLLLSLYSAASSLSCRWMDHKFSQHSEKSLELLDRMENNSTNTTGDAEVKSTAAFPYDLYSQASKASAEEKLGFTVQILEEAAALFEEDHSSASWEERTLEDFLNVVTQQADGLRSCIGSHGHKKKNKKLHMYFKRLSRHVLEQMGHGAEAWELVRKEIRDHLTRADLLVSSLLTTN